MSGSDKAAGFDAARHCEAMSAALRLPITEAQRPGVLQFLEVAHLMAETVRTAPIADGSFELAPVFRPGRTGEN